MIIKFNFKHEGGIPHGTNVPSNLLLAYSNAKKQKLNNLLLSLAFGLLFCFFIINADRQFVPMFAGQTWRTLFAIGNGICMFCFGSALMWRGPWATLLFTVMSTQGFEAYLDQNIIRMEGMIDPQNRTVNFISSREAKKIEKEIITAHILKQLLEESDQITDLYDAINFVEENCVNVYGFVIKELKDEKR